MNEQAVNKVLTQYVVENANLKIQLETVEAEKKALQDELDLIKSEYDVTTEDLKGE